MTRDEAPAVPGAGGKNTAGHAAKAACQVCGVCRPRREMMPAAAVREAVVESFQKGGLAWDPAGFICIDDLNRLRASMVQALLATEKGELSAVENQVIESIRAHDTVAANVENQFDATLSFGDRVADRVAVFGGSWVFIIGFIATLAAWVVLNSLALGTRPFDPYPFIFLNLILSCLAAFQAPVIMMSQRRQESKDRLRSEHDYKVNLKAELEIRNLATKMDLLISHQWQHLLEIQQVQTDMMNEVLRTVRHP